jgi:hypothetical protein
MTTGGDVFICRQGDPAAAVWERVSAHLTTVDPTVNDDAVSGYPAGTIWINDGGNQRGWLSVDGATGAAVWVKITTGAEQTSLFTPASTIVGNLGAHPVDGVGQAATGRMGFHVPDNFGTLVACKVMFFPTAGSAGAGKNIDITTEYCGDGEIYNQHTATDNTTLYDFTGRANIRTEIDIAPLLGLLSPDDQVGIQVSHNAVGGNINYIGVDLVYIPA